MSDLIADLEAAEAGSRELSDRVLLACGWSFSNEHWFGPGENMAWMAEDAPDPARSIDDAVALVPDGMIWQLDSAPNHYCIMGRPSAKGNFHKAGGKFISYRAGSCALALCIAILKAKADD